MPEVPKVDTQPELWFMDTVNMAGFEPSFFIDVSEYAELKQQMLCCHKSQLARWEDRDFSPLEEVMRVQYTARGASKPAFRLPKPSACIRPGNGRGPGRRRTPRDVTLPFFLVALAIVPLDFFPLDFAASRVPRAADLAVFALPRVVARGFRGPGGIGSSS